MLTLLRLSAAQSTKMDCGPRVNACGVLTLESGLGPGVYGHTEPSVHGLWPEVGSYGTSACIAPSVSTASPTRVYSCYDGISGTTTAGQLTFETHEWGKHGVCAGTKDADDYFGQICDLAMAPTAVIKVVKDKGGSLTDMQSALIAANYSIFDTDQTNDQLALSACLKQGPVGNDWVIAAVSDFENACGSDVPPPPPSPSPPTPTPGPPTPPGTVCVKNTHGPLCSADADCISVQGCVRCAKSGYCTDVPVRLRRGANATRVGGGWS